MEEQSQNLNSFYSNTMHNHNLFKNEFLPKNLDNNLQKPNGSESFAEVEKLNFINSKREADQNSLFEEKVEEQENILFNDPLAQTATFQSFPYESDLIQEQGEFHTHIRKIESTKSLKNEPTDMGNEFSFELYPVRMPPVKINNTQQNTDIINYKGLEQEIEKKNVLSTGPNEIDFITNNNLENKDLDIGSNLDINNNEEYKFENYMDNNVILPEFGGIDAQDISEYSSTNVKSGNKQAISDGKTTPLFEGNLTSTRIEPMAPEIDNLNNNKVPSFESSANVGEYLGLDDNPAQYDYLFNSTEQNEQKQPYPEHPEANNLTTYTNEQFSSDNDELLNKLIIDTILTDLSPLKTSDILKKSDQQISYNNNNNDNQLFNNLTSDQSEPYPLPINNEINTSTIYEAKPIENITTSINIPQEITSTSPSQEFSSNSFPNSSPEIDSSLPITQTDFQTIPPDEYISEPVQEIKSQVPPQVENQLNNLPFEIKSSPLIPTENIPLVTSVYPTENNLQNIYSSQSQSIPLVDIPAQNQITTFPKTVIPLENQIQNNQNQNIYIFPFPQTEITQYTTENPITNFSNNILPMIPPPPPPTALNTQTSYVPFPIIGAPTDNSSFGYDNQSNYLSQAQPYQITLPQDQVATINILPYETQNQNINIFQENQANPSFNYNYAQPSPYSTYPTTQSTNITNITNNMRAETEIVPVEEVEYIPVKKVKYVKKTKVYVPSVQQVIVPVKQKVIVPVRKTIYVPKNIEVPSPAQSQNLIMPNYSQTEPQMPPNYSSMSHQVNIYNSNNLPYSTNSLQAEIDDEMEEHAIPLYEMNESKAQFGPTRQSFEVKNTSINSINYGALSTQSCFSPVFPTSSRNSIIHSGKLYSPTTYRARSLFNKIK